MQVARFVGIPGAGKTYRSIGIMEKCCAMGFNVQQIGFFTFTRAARREAAGRAAKAFGCPIRQLESTGWFRTIHSATMRLLGVKKGELVNGNREWFKKNFSENVESDSSEGWADQWKGFTPVAQALKLWDVARNRLCEVSDVYRQVRRLAGHSAGRMKTIGLGHAERIIEEYEAAKQRDGMLDFCDIILRYAGIRMTPSSVQEWQPEGADLLLQAVFLDEAQDSSAALDRAFSRLAQHAKYVYLMGDPNQEIYSWAGADGSKFMGWPVPPQYDEFMTKSWRCAKEILDMGTRLIVANDQKHDLENIKLEPRCEGGSVTREDMRSQWHAAIDPRKPTLVLSRTNQGAYHLGKILSENEIPWRSNRGGSRWPAESASKYLESMLNLQQGKAVHWNDWRRIVLELPAEMLERGTKKRLKEEKYEKDSDGPEEDAADSGETADAFADPDAAPLPSKRPPVALGDLQSLGATPELVQEIASGRWLITQLDEAQRQIIDVLDKWGDVARNPRVIVSTIHGTKGAEAEDVFLDTAISYPVQKAILYWDGREQERRVWYTGITRAKQNLTLLHDPRAKHFQEVYQAQ